MMAGESESSSLREWTDIQAQLSALTASIGSGEGGGALDTAAAAIIRARLCSLRVDDVRIMQQLEGRSRTLFQEQNDLGQSLTHMRDELRQGQVKMQCLKAELQQAEIRKGDLNVEIRAKSKELASHRHRSSKWSMSDEVEPEPPPGSADGATRKAHRMHHLERATHAQAADTRLAQLRAELSSHCMKGKVHASEAELANALKLRGMLLQDVDARGAQLHEQAESCASLERELRTAHQVLADAGNSSFQFRAQIAELKEERDAAHAEVHQLSASIAASARQASPARVRNHVASVIVDSDLAVLRARRVNLESASLAYRTEMDEVQTFVVASEREISFIQHELHEEASEAEALCKRIGHIRRNSLKPIQSEVTTQTDQAEVPLLQDDLGPVPDKAAYHQADADPDFDPPAQVKHDFAPVPADLVLIKGDRVPVKDDASSALCGWAASPHGPNTPTFPSSSNNPGGALPEPLKGVEGNLNKNSLEINLADIVARNSALEQRMRALREKRAG